MPVTFTRPKGAGLLLLNFADPELDLDKEAFGIRHLLSWYQKHDECKKEFACKVVKVVNLHEKVSVDALLNSFADQAVFQANPNLSAIHLCETADWKFKNEKENWSCLVAGLEKYLSINYLMLSGDFTNQSLNNIAISLPEKIIRENSLA